MLVFAGKVHNLRHFSFGDLVRVNATFADTVLMYMHHDPVRRFMVLVEETLEDVDHELHRRVVVVEQQHAIEVRPLGLRPCLGNDRGPGRAVAFTLAIVVRQPGWHMDSNVNQRHWFVRLPDCCTTSRRRGRRPLTARIPTQRVKLARITRQIDRATSKWETPIDRMRTATAHIFEVQARGSHRSPLAEHKMSGGLRGWPKLRW